MISFNTRENERICKFYNDGSCKKGSQSVHVTPLGAFHNGTSDVKLAKSNCNSLFNKDVGDIVVSCPFSKKVPWMSVLDGSLFWVDALSVVDDGVVLDDVVATLSCAT